MNVNKYANSCLPNSDHALIYISIVCNLYFTAQSPVAIIVAVILVVLLLIVLGALFVWCRYYGGRSRVEAWRKKRLVDCYTNHTNNLQHLLVLKNYFLVCLFLVWPCIPCSHVPTSFHVISCHPFTILDISQAEPA